MKEATLNQFTLNKVKKHKSGGITVEYEITNGHETITYKQTSTDEPHPDMLDKLYDLSEYAVTILNLNQNTVDVTGVIVGKKNESVVLIGNINTLSGLPISFATHRVKYDDGVYDIETQLSEITKQIITEVYLYVFKSKKAQLLLFE